MSSITSESHSTTSGFEAIHDYEIGILNPLIHLIDIDTKPFMNFAAINNSSASTSNLPSSDAIHAFQDSQRFSVSDLNPFAQSFSVPMNSDNLLQMPNTLHPISNHQNQQKKLFVGNLPTNTSIIELFELFKLYGQVNEQLSTVKDDNYAFIHYYSERDAECAQKALSDSYFKGRYIRVQYSHSKGHIKKTKRMFLNTNIFLA